MVEKIAWQEPTAGHTASTVGEQGEMNVIQYFPSWTLAQGMVPPTFQVAITPLWKHHHTLPGVCGLGESKS